MGAFDVSFKGNLNTYKNIYVDFYRCIWGNTALYYVGRVVMEIINSLHKTITICTFEGGGSVYFERY